MAWIYMGKPLIITKTTTSMCLAQELICRAATLLKLAGVSSTLKNDPQLSLSSQTKNLTRQRRKKCSLNVPPLGHGLSI